MAKLPNLNDFSDELELLNDDDSYFQDDFSSMFDDSYLEEEEKLKNSLVSDKKEKIPKEEIQQDPLEYDFAPPPSSELYTNSFHEDGWIDNINLDLILSYGIRDGASDIHLTANEPIAFTKDKSIIKRDDFPIPTNDVMMDLASSILNNVERADYLKNKDFDFSYTIKFGRYAGRRFRANIGLSFKTDFLVFRTISDTIPLPKEIEVPDEVIGWANLPSGVWIVGGATGSGKSTTLASLMYNIQLNQPKKIMTIEKPIEYIYPKNEGKALIVQREVGDDQDTLSFSNGLTAAMRENPDIILIGEVRNTEEVSELIRAAETGHLAISTIHTNSVPTTINRIFSLFTPEEQGRIRSTLSDTLKGLMNQNLVRKKNGGMFAVREVLTVNQQIRKYISNGDAESVRQYMIKHQITMEHELIKAYKKGRCNYEEARSLAPDLELFDNIINDKINYNSIILK